MKNVTISLPEELARWVRVWAAKNEKSVSRMVADLLTQIREHEDGYEKAMEHFLAAKPLPLKRSGVYPGREEVHARKGIRR